MKPYKKIQSVFKRDGKGILMCSENGYEDDFSTPEFEYLKNNRWHFTEKIHGTNIRIMWKDNEFSFGGRTDNAQIPVMLIKHLEDTFIPLKDLFMEKFLDTDVAIYGEGYGVKVQKGGGRYLADSNSFITFDIKIGAWWLTYDKIIILCDELGIPYVPSLGTGTLRDMLNLVKDGFTSEISEDPMLIAEGIVAKPDFILFTKNGSRIVTKLKYEDFIRNK